MEWKKDLYILVENKSITNTEYNNLILLPDIRDEVFFPDYKKYNYLPQEIEIVMTQLLISINFGLLSIDTNRILSLSYSFLKSEMNCLNGSFTDIIFLLNEENTGNNKIDIEVLVKNRFNQKLEVNYHKIYSNNSTFLSKARESLLEIKSNFDNYALDIINGENWDRNSWRDLRG